MESSLNLSITEITQAYVHRIGNKHNGCQITFSEREIDLQNRGLGQEMSAFFLKPFQIPEFQKFTFTNGDALLNPMFQFASKIFGKPSALFDISRDIARHLFALSEHPQIKSGDLFVVYFDHVVFENVTTQALGLFKAENKLPFLDVFEGSEGLEVHLVDGIHLEKIDKACLIVNAHSNDGYRVLSVDRTNKSQEAAYWTYHFLRIEACADDFHRTKILMHDTRQFLNEALRSESGVDKTTQIDLLNKSVEYFRENDAFVPREFEETVFKEAGLVNAYRTFKQQRTDDPAFNEDAPFNLSGAAVKKYGKVYKSVLKLDKNFHVYIHGDRSLIERGTDADGRKYYKIYYDEEH